MFAPLCNAPGVVASVPKDCGPPRRGDLKVLDPELQRLAKMNPESRVDTIVTARNTLEGMMAVLPDGVYVRRVYKLRKCIAARGTASAFESLARSIEVRSIEPDRTVSAQHE